MQEFKRALARNLDLAEMGDIKEPRLCPCGIMLFYYTRILDGQKPAVERHYLGVQTPVGLVEGGLLVFGIGHFISMLILASIATEPP